MKSFITFANRFMKTMINEKNKHSWCVNAEHSMSANNDGSTKMCCMIKDSYNNFEKTNKYIIGETSIVENFNNPSSIKIREDLKAGIRNSACDACWQEEDGGRKSKRMRDNEKYLHAKKYQGKVFSGLVNLELNLGNNCNIKCRTCHPSISSQWMKEAYDLDHKGRISSYKKYAESMKKYHQHYDDESPFWSDLENNLQTIRQFDFYGGEPFLSKKMWEILKLCVDKDYSKNIELHFNTNGTTWPKNIDESFKHFKEVNLSFSIDGIGERFEYMRYLAKWDEVRNNMEKARTYMKTYGNMSLSWCITLSTINIFYLKEILDFYYANYAKDFGLYLNLVHGPKHFNISTLPEDIKEFVLNEINSIPENYESAKHQIPGIAGFIENGVSDIVNWNLFSHHIKKHDEYRKQNFSQTFPEYHKILNDKGLF